MAIETSDGIAVSTVVVVARACDQLAVELARVLTEKGAANRRPRRFHEHPSSEHLMHHVGNIGQRPEKGGQPVEVEVIVTKDLADIPWWDVLVCSAYPYENRRHCVVGEGKKQRFQLQCPLELNSHKTTFVIFQAREDSKLSERSRQTKEMSRLASVADDLAARITDRCLPVTRWVHAQRT